MKEDQIRIPNRQNKRIRYIYQNRSVIQSNKETSNERTRCFRANCKMFLPVCSSHQIAIACFAQFHSSSPALLSFSSLLTFVSLCFSSKSKKHLFGFWYEFDAIIRHRQIIQFTCLCCVHQEPSATALFPRGFSVISLSLPTSVSIPQQYS